jgi:hypothetical protein
MHDGRFGVNLIDFTQLDLAISAALLGAHSPRPEFPPEAYEWCMAAPLLKAAKVQLVCRSIKKKMEEVRDVYGTTAKLEIVAEPLRIRLKQFEHWGPAGPMRVPSLSLLTRAPCALLEALTILTRYRICQKRDKSEKPCRGGMHSAAAGGSACEACAQACILRVQRALKFAEKIGNTEIRKYVNLIRELGELENACVAKD